MLTEKQLNSRSSVLPIEDIFTDADVNPFTDYDMQRGYKFDYPARWMNDPSEYKRIGIRRLDVTPTAHTYNTGVMIYDRPVLPSADYIQKTWGLKTERTLIDTNNFDEAEPLFDEAPDIPSTGPFDGYIAMAITHVDVHKKDSEDQIDYKGSDGTLSVKVHIDSVDVRATVRRYIIEGAGDRYKVDELEYESLGELTRRRYETVTYNFSWLPSNNMEEILKETCRAFNTAFTDTLTKVGEGADPTGVPKFNFTFQYDHRTGDLDLRCRAPGVLNYIPFVFTYDDVIDRDDAFMIFNQRMLYKSPMTRVNEDVPVMHLSNVWNRDRIFVHASFSETRRNIIGIAGDRYDAPSKFFHAPTNTSEFNIWFSTDGKNVILPLYCPFVIELCFLMNYKTAKIT